MKRFISVMAVVVMLLTLAVPAFADGPSEVVGQAPTVDKATDGDGNDITDKIEVEAAKDLPDEQEMADALEAAGDAAKDADTAEVFDVTFDGKEHAEGTFKVVVTHKDGAVVGAASQDANGKWHKVTVNPLGNGQYELVFEDLFTVVLFVDSDAEPASAPAKDKTSDKSTGKKSPQTGYDNTVYAVVMTGLLLCAGFCFVRAGKKETN